MANPLRGPALDDPKREQWLRDNCAVDLRTPAGRHVTISDRFAALGNYAVNQYLKGYDAEAEAAGEPVDL